MKKTSKVKKIRQHVLLIIKKINSKKIKKYKRIINIVSVIIILIFITKVVYFNSNIAKTEPKVPLIKQCEGPWANEKFFCDLTFCKYGCSITAMSMILQYYGKNVDPSFLIKQSAWDDFTDCEKGFKSGYMRHLAWVYGLNFQENISWEEAINYLRKGVPVIAKVNGCQFTNLQHYLILTHLNQDGSIKLNDSGPRNIENAPENDIKRCLDYLMVILP